MAKFAVVLFGQATVSVLPTCALRVPTRLELTDGPVAVVPSGRVRVEPVAGCVKVSLLNVVAVRAVNAPVLGVVPPIGPGDARFVPVTVMLSVDPDTVQFNPLTQFSTKYFLNVPLVVPALWV